jgi:sensor histidine kinase YesM
MDACRKLPADGERFINIDIFIKNDHLVLTVKNSFDGFVKTYGGEFKTTKQDSVRHGIGMGNMKRVVEKYDGHILTNCEGKVFVLSAVMYCKAGIEKAV